MTDIRAFQHEIRLSLNKVLDASFVFFRAAIHSNRIDSSQPLIIDQHFLVSSEEHILEHSNVSLKLEKLLDVKTIVQSFLALLEPL